MNLLLVVSALSLVGLAVAEPVLYPRGCIGPLGTCVRECEVGTHAYVIGCGFLTTEATCNQTNPTTETEFMICDFSACYCDSPTVRDEVSGKCVNIEDCPKK